MKKIKLLMACAMATTMINSGFASTTSRDGLANKRTGIPPLAATDSAVTRPSAPTAEFVRPGDRDAAKVTIRSSIRDRPGREMATQTDAPSGSTIVAAEADEAFSPARERRPIGKLVVKRDPNDLFEKFVKARMNKSVDQGGFEDGYRDYYEAQNEDEFNAIKNKRQELRRQFTDQKNGQIEEIRREHDTLSQAKERDVQNLASMRHALNSAQGVKAEAIATIEAQEKKAVDAYKLKDQRLVDQLADTTSSLSTLDQDRINEKRGDAAKLHQKMIEEYTQEKDGVDKRFQDILRELPIKIEELSKEITQKEIRMANYEKEANDFQSHVNLHAGYATSSERKGVKGRFSTLEGATWADLERQRYLAAHPVFGVDTHPEHLGKLTRTLSMQGEKFRDHLGELIVLAPYAEGLMTEKHDRLMREHASEMDAARQQHQTLERSLHEHGQHATESQNRLQLALLTTREQAEQTSKQLLDQERAHEKERTEANQRAAEHAAKLEEAVWLKEEEARIARRSAEFQQAGYLTATPPTAGGMNSMMQMMQMMQLMQGGDSFQGAGGGLGDTRPAIGYRGGSDQGAFGGGLGGGSRPSAMAARNAAAVFEALDDGEPEVKIIPKKR